MSTSCWNCSVHPIENGEPRAIVLLLGWLGSNLRNVEKYSKNYQERNCVTVTGTVEPVYLMTGRTSVIDDFVKHAAQLVAQELRKHPGLPVVAHVFSNGGGFPLLRLHGAMKAAKSATDLTQMNKDLILVSDAMERGMSIFDSAPAYPDAFTACKAVGSSAPNRILAAAFQAAYLIFFVIDTTLLLLRGQSTRAEEYWGNFMAETFTPRQGYIYSTADQITNAKKLNELIEYKAKKQNIDMKVLEFQDSAHVLHFRKHPEKYVTYVDEVLESVKVSN